MQTQMVADCQPKGAAGLAREVADCLQGVFIVLQQMPIEMSI